MSIIKRLISGVFTIFILTVVVFIMFQIIPGNPVLSQLGADDIEDNPQLAERFRQEFRMDDPVYIRYVNWVKNTLRGNLGNSFKYRKPVIELIKKRIPPTMIITVCSMIITILVSIPLGLFISKKEKSRMNITYNILSQLGLAIPSFWLAILLMWFFSLKLKILPTRSTINMANPILTIKSLVMPVIVLSLGNISIVIRYLVNAVNDEKHKEYVVLAKSKGLLDDMVIKKHVFKNVLIPIITVLSMALINLAMGSIIIENVFNIQGLGSLLIVAIRESDYPVAQGVILLYSVIVIFINLIVDILYMIVDPRIDLKS